jgi:hypothetical protein
MVLDYVGMLRVAQERLQHPHLAREPDGHHRPVFFLRFVVGRRGEKALQKRNHRFLRPAISNQIRMHSPGPFPAKTCRRGSCQFIQSRLSTLASQHQGRLAPTEQAIWFDELLPEESTLSRNYTKDPVSLRSARGDGFQGSRQRSKDIAGSSSWHPGPLVRHSCTPLPKKIEVVLGRLPASNSPICRRSLRRREKTRPAWNIKGDENGYQFRRRPSQAFTGVCIAMSLPRGGAEMLTRKKGASRYALPERSGFSRNEMSVAAHCPRGITTGEEPRRPGCRPPVSHRD